jgi:ubiquinone/menaquinone biosynthesis C-methylase UbiE
MAKDILTTESPVLLEAEKQRTREQWSQDPCGAIYAQELEFGTREFFDQVERHRYHDYAPWMPDTMGFNQFPGARLLEIGCGMGTDLLQFARGGAICTGMDLTPQSIEITRHRFSLYGQQGTFLVSDGERLPFPRESFDVVYSNGVLHHTPDTEGAVREIHRVLRKDGTAKVMLYHRNSLNYWIEIILRRGILKAEFLRGRNAEEIMSRVIEHSEHEARPLVKVYNRSEAEKLFAPFSDVKSQVTQLSRDEFRIFKGLVSDSLLKRLEQRIGWNVVVTARK